MAEIQHPSLSWVSGAMDSSVGMNLMGSRAIVGSMLRTLLGMWRIVLRIGYRWAIGAIAGAMGMTLLMNWRSGW